MLQLKKIQYIYFIGIGGIGMSALARWFTNSDYSGVAGYDRVATPLTSQLMDEGILIHFEDDVEKIPPFITTAKNETLVVYTPAIPPEHKELTFFRENGFTVLKRAEVLGLITKDKFTIAVAGTHGKTTIASMIAYILNYAGLNCTAFLGGISVNFNSNLLMTNPKSPNHQISKSPNIYVVEADEYDRSFLALHPDIAVISSVDADHLDIYGNEDALKRSFCDFIGQVKRKLIIKEGIDLDLPVTPRKVPRQDGDKRDKDLSVEKYKIAKNIRIENASFMFDAERPNINNLKLSVPGYHNVENAIAAISVACYLGVDTKSISGALASYKGVKRRFEYIIKSDTIIYIDDYAHHPTEITAFINSVRAMYKDEMLTIIFQPHLYSRTKAFARGFSDSLNLADKIILMDIYPARETAMEGISSEIIFDNLKNEKILCNKDNLLEIVKQLQTGILVTLGAGDIDQFIEPIKKILLEKYKLKL
ncbi:MAG: UDP-N-acetylmuramate--L-alanine ligase [Cytophagales bacterium]|nr:UDP-N-acetylmuramate--L-alanine ligase [Cytophagales bacterium]